MATVRLLAVVAGKQRQIEVDFDSFTNAEVVQRPLTEEEISEGKMTLSKTPSSPEQVILVWLGVTQKYGIDFDVSGPNLNFKTPFIGHIAAGDFITVQF
jgi:hypothetical protein